MSPTTDADECTTTDTITIDEPEELILNVTNPLNVNCFGEATGSATVEVTGGTEPYSYSWPSGNMTQTDSGLIAGSYIVTIVDVNNCTTTEEVIIEQSQMVLVVLLNLLTLLPLGNIQKFFSV